MAQTDRGHREHHGAIALGRAELAASVLALMVTASGGPCRATESVLDMVDRYYSVDPTIATKGFAIKISRSVANYLIKAQKEDAEKKFD